MVDRRRCGIEVTEGVGVDADEEEAVLALVISRTACFHRAATPDLDLNRLADPVKHPDAILDNPMHASSISWRWVCPHTGSQKI
jgi:hypothetical protein